MFRQIVLSIEFFSFKELSTLGILVILNPKVFYTYAKPIHYINTLLQFCPDFLIKITLKI